jgi:hypothetical protein
MESGLKDRSLDDVLESIVKIPTNHDQLAHWIISIEITAKHLCDDKHGDVMLKLTEDKKIDYYLKDRKSRDCLVKAIEIHLRTMPESLQGVFSVLKYNLKNLKFDKT